MTPRSQRPSTRKRDAGRKIMGVPARIMGPRLTLIAMVAILVCFGLVMIFSASSVEALFETGDAAFYVKRQLEFVGLGLVLAVVVALVDYHSLCGRLLLPIWLVSVGLLVAVWLFGTSTNGATRWIQVGPVSLQPSEFAKITILLAETSIAERYFGSKDMDTSTLVWQLVLFVGAPVILIFFQPDKGSAGVVFIMLLAVALTAGLPVSTLVKIVLGISICALAFVFVDDYALQRVLTMFNPWADQYGDGYQITRGFMAFGSGGLFGRGIGLSRMKYAYLPEAHNDFIFAIVGEELGLIGTLAVLAAFAVFVYAGLRVSRSASDLTGRLLAVGATTLIMVQALLNISGVLGLFPLSGKPLPFLSYGGSSIMSCLAFVGLIVNVSLRSELPETVHDERRRAMTLAPEVSASSHEAGALRARTPPGASSGGTRRAFRVVEGGAPHEGGFERIDLGPSASERLRSSTASQVHEGRSSSSHGSGSRRPSRRG